MKSPEPELLIRDVYSMKTAVVFNVMDTSPSYIVNLEDRDGTILSTENVDSILLGDVMCSLQTTRAISVQKIIFTFPVNCVVRNKTLIVSPVLED